MGQTKKNILKTVSQAAFSFVKVLFTVFMYLRLAFVSFQWKNIGKKLLI